MAYDYVRRMYGVDPQPGTRVQHLEASRAHGTIVVPEREDQYVHVLFDGADRPGRCHPKSLDYAPGPAIGELRVVEGNLVEYGADGCWTTLRPAMITHYGLHRPHAANSPMVKSAEFFRSEGGLRDSWGKSWEPIYEADSFGAARRGFAARKGHTLASLYDGEA